MVKLVHYRGSTEDDEGWCGDFVLGGGTYKVEKVNCIECLHGLVEIGKQAHAQLVITEQKVNEFGEETP